MINLGAIYIDVSPNRPGLKDKEKHCKTIPKVNGKWLTYGDVFNLYCTEIGKPQNLIYLYQCSQLIDIEVLQILTQINGNKLPAYLDTIESN